MRWDAVAVSDPRRVLAVEVLTTLQARIPRFSRNGAEAGSNGNFGWRWLRKPSAASEAQHKDEERVAQ